MGVEAAIRPLAMERRFDSAAQREDSRRSLRLHRIQCVHYGFLGTGEKVAIAIKDAAHGSVPGPGRDRLGIASGGDPEAHCRMAQVMHSESIESCPMNRW